MLLSTFEMDIINRTEHSYLVESEAQLNSDVQNIGKTKLSHLFHAILRRLSLLERLHESLVSRTDIAEIVRKQNNIMSAVANNADAILALHQTCGSSSAGNGQTLTMIKTTAITPVRMLVHHQLQRNTRNATAFGAGPESGWSDVPSTSSNNNTYSLDYYYYLWSEDHSFSWLTAGGTVTRGLRLKTYNRDHDTPADNVTEITINPEGLGALYKRYLSTVLKGLIVLGGRTGVISFEANDVSGMFDLLDESTMDSFTIPGRVSNYIDGKLGILEGDALLRPYSGLSKIREDYMAQTPFRRSGSGTRSHPEEALRWKRTVYVGNGEPISGVTASATRVFELDLGSDLTEVSVFLDSGEYPSFSLGGDEFGSSYLPQNFAVANRVSSAWVPVSPVAGFTVTIS
jgi:hypothetical protein